MSCHAFMLQARLLSFITRPYARVCVHPLDRRVRNKCVPASVIERAGCQLFTFRHVRRAALFHLNVRGMKRMQRCLRSEAPCTRVGRTSTVKLCVMGMHCEARQVHWSHQGGCG